MQIETPLIVAAASIGITLGAGFCAWIVRQMIEHARVFGEVKTELSNHREDIAAHDSRIARLEYDRRGRLLAD